MIVIVFERLHPPPKVTQSSGRLRIQSTMVSLPHKQARRSAPPEATEERLGDELSPEQRHVINLVADHQLTRGAHITGVMLRSQMAGKDRAGKNQLIESVVGSYSYLDPVMVYPEDHYQLTLWGWLASKYADRVHRLIDGMLQFFRQRFEADPDFRSYSWAELKAAGLAPNDVEQHFISEILFRCGLMRGGSPNGWGRPGDIEEIIEVEGSNELILRVAGKTYQEQQREERGRKRIEAGLLPWGDDAVEDLLFSDGTEEEELDFTMIFISHSSKDAALAKALVDCLEACMAVPEDAIRCTSVPGHMLDPGDATDEVLRDNLERCRVVIGLLSEESLKSAYVLMELGAAWGFRKVVCGVLTDDMEFSRVPGPMSRLNAIRATSEESIHGLLETIARATEFELKRRPKCVQAVKSFVAAAKGTTKKRKAPPG